MRYALSVNRTIRGKLAKDATPGEWARFNDAFEACELTAAEIAAVIQDGYAIAPVHAGRRKRANWRLAQHIGIDLDDGALSWDEVTDLPLVARHAAIVHMTASSAPAHPRMRVLFLLDEPLTDPDGYTRAVGAMLQHFRTADPHCADPSRLFFGAPDCVLLLMPDNRMTADDLAAVLADNPAPADALPRPTADRPARGPADHGGYIIPPARLSAARRDAHAAALLANIHHAPDGAKWATLRDIARTFGGYAAAGYYTEEEARQLLRAAIETRRATVASMAAAYRTIDLGLAYGALAPLYYRDDGRPARTAAPYYTPGGAAVGDAADFRRALVDARIAELEQLIASTPLEEAGDFGAWVDEYGTLMRAWG